MEILVNADQTSHNLANLGSNGAVHKNFHKHNQADIVESFLEIQMDSSLKLSVQAYQDGGNDVQV